MRLISRIMLNTTVVLAVGLSVWSVVFYYVMKDRLVRETDAALMQVAEALMQRYLAGEESLIDGEGSVYTIRFIPVPDEYARSHRSLSFSNQNEEARGRSGRQAVRTVQMIFRQPDNQAVALQVSTPMNAVHNLRMALLWGVVILYGALLVLVLSINYIVIQYSMRPLYVLLDWMKHFDLKHNSAPLVNETGVAEFRQLNHAANQQVERVKRLYEQQRQFIDNAAHEMQTPLAVCLNQMERMQQKEDMPEEMQADLYRLQRPLRRLVRLHKDMLQLTRIENGVYAERTDVDVRALVAGTCEDLSEVFAHKGITYIIKSESPLHVQMNDTLAHQLVGNLLRNAWLHTPEGGRITVEWNAEEAVFANSGEKPLDGERIFERFYQGERKENSNGLGLAICRSVCQQCGFSLTYSFKEGMHRFIWHFRGEKNADFSENRVQF